MSRTWPALAPTMMPDFCLTSFGILTMVVSVGVADRGENGCARLGWVCRIRVLAELFGTSRGLGKTDNHVMLCSGTLLLFYATNFMLMVLSTTSGSSLTRLSTWPQDSRSAAFCQEKRVAQVVACLPTSDGTCKSRVSFAGPLLLHASWKRATLIEQENANYPFAESWTPPLRNKHNWKKDEKPVDGRSGRLYPGASGKTLLPADMSCDVFVIPALAVVSRAPPVEERQR